MKYGNLDPIVWIVDDDEAMRSSLKWLIESVGMRVESFSSAGAFLDRHYPGRFGCLLLDVRMPGMSGLELLDHLRKEQMLPPAIIITGHGDVPMAVRAMKAGAVDFIEKPFNDEVLLDSIRRAVMAEEERRVSSSELARIVDRIDHLTPRENEVMMMVTNGKSNKEIASNLGVSAKTIEAHRARVMEKMQAGSLAELVRMVMAVEQRVGA